MQWKIMNMDNETWLIEIGDEVIKKKVEFDYINLSDLEKAT
jgi:hypothetical protein